MSNLSNLTSKIIEDANLKAKEIYSSALAQEVEILNKSKSQAEKKKAEIIEKSKVEAVTKKERIISNAYLEVRDNKLKAKQEVINKVFDEALTKLNNLSTEQYSNFVRNYILSLDICGDEEIIIGEKENDKILSELLPDINSLLKAKGKKGELKLSLQKRNIQGGFILYKNGIEINCTFVDLVPSLRDELENEVVGALFN